MFGINIRKITPVIIVVFVSLVLGLSVRGLSGNPTEEDLQLKAWTENGPLELSPERGRFALLYSIIEDRSLKFSLPLAKFTVPDLAVDEEGNYVSLFAPAVSYLVIPGYMIGKWLGASQVGAYSVIMLFALANMILIRGIAGRLDVRPLAGWLAGFSFVFATPAFAYAVNLYQHHISTFLILASLYALLRWKGWVSLSVVWFLCALSIVVDNPNLFLMFPIGAYALGRIIAVRREESGLRLAIKPFHILTFVVMVIPIAAFLWFNNASHGDPFRLSGSLPSVPAIGEDGRPTQSAIAQMLGIQDLSGQEDKTATGFFKTRNLLNGFFIHIVGPDRGIIVFAPIVLLGIWGLIMLYRRRSSIAALFVAIVAVDIVLYSLWGDPWGGWAFGSRYLIPGYAVLAIGLAFALESWRRSALLITLFFLLFSYSVGVNTLGALTSSANPPQIQVLDLEKSSGKIQRYSYDRNWQYLREKGSKSFVYLIAGKNIMTAEQYYYLVFGLVILGGGVLTAGLIWEGRHDQQGTVKAKKRTV